MWYAGIDWADRHHDAVVIDGAGKRVASIRVEHSREGLEKLVGFLRGIGDVAERPEQLACVLEINRGLLIAALLEAGLPVYPVNPKTVDRHRRPSGAKTDAIDAYLLARTGRSDLADLRRLAPDSPVIEELKVLTRDRQGLIQAQTRLVNQLTACLKAYYPATLGLFSQLHQRTALAFLRVFPTPQEAESAEVEAIAEVLRSARHPYPDTKAKRIAMKLKEPQLRADVVTTRAKSRLMLAIATQLLPLIEAITGYDREIERMFASHPDSAIFTSLPGSGDKLAPRLLAEWGEDRGRYEDASSVQALAGTSPVAYQSGEYSRARKRSACSKPFRDALYQFAWLSTQSEPWAADYYARKRREGKTHTMGVRALGNQWVRIIHALWVKREAYDRAVFLQARRDHAPRAA